MGTTTQDLTDAANQLVFIQRLRRKAQAQNGELSTADIVEVHVELMRGAPTREYL